MSDKTGQSPARAVPNRKDLGQLIGVYWLNFRSIYSFWYFMIPLLALAYTFGRHFGATPIDLPSAGLTWLYFTVCATAGLYVVVKFYSVRVYEGGIEGRNDWGLKRRFFWYAIASQREEPNGFGRLATVLVEQGSGREILVFNDIFYSPDFQSAAANYLVPNSPEQPDLIR